MDKRKDKQLFDVGFQLVRWSRLDPERSKRTIKLVAIAIMVPRIVLIYLSLELIRQAHGDINIIAGAMEALISWSQGLLKLFPLFLNRSDFLYLKHAMNKFWSYEDDKIIDKYYNYSIKSLSIYKSLVATALATFVVNCFLKDEVLFECWVPGNSKTLTWIISACQLILIIEDIFFVIGVDMIFMACCFNIVVQLQLLNKKIEALQPDSKHFKEDLWKCISQHTFLLRYIEVLIQTFTFSMFGQYVIITCTFCVEICAFTENFSTEVFIKSATYITAISFQLGIYCFFAEEVTANALQVAHAMFNSEWYAFPISIQKQAIIIIMRSQKTPRFTAGGFAAMNRATFTTIFRLAFSFSTVIRDAQKKD